MRTVFPEGLLNSIKRQSSIEMIHTKSELKKDHKRWQKRVFRFIMLPASQLFLVSLLFLSLFMADSFVAGNSPDVTNPRMWGVLLAVFIVFMIETFILSLVQDGYFLSFFFWMDLLGTLSIILDIGWIANTFLPAGQKTQGTSVLRAAKLGARYGRLMRLLKLMRFVRFIPCLKQPKVDEKTEQTMSAVRKVSSDLSTVLSQRVAAIIMVLVIVVPFLNYTVVDYSAGAWVDAIKSSAKPPYPDSLSPELRIARLHPGYSQSAMSKTPS